MKKYIKDIFYAALLLLAFINPVKADVYIPPPNVVYQNGTYALAPSTYINAKVLAAGVAETETIPTGPTGKKAAFVLFGSSCDFYVNFYATAAVPAADITNGSSPELNPLFRYVTDKGTFSLITSATSCVVTMQYFYQP